MKKVFGLLASLAVAGSAQAAVVSYDFTVTVRSTYRCSSNTGCVNADPLSMGAGTLTLGDIGHGHISFDTETPQASAGHQMPAPAHGTRILYQGAGASNDLFLRFGDTGSVFQQDAPSNSAPNIWVQNDVRYGSSSNQDYFSYNAIQTLNSFSNQSLNIDLSDSSGTALTGGGIPLSLGGFKFGSYTYTYYIGANDWSFVDGDIQLTPAVPVPEPGTYAMLLAGLGMLAWRRKRDGAHTR